MVNASAERASADPAILDWLIKNVGPHALASQVCADGAGGGSLNGPGGSPDDLVVRGLVSRGRAVRLQGDRPRHYLQQIQRDNLASMIGLPQYGVPVVSIHAAAGQPVFDGTGVRVADVLRPMRAGATFQAVTPTTR